MLTLKLNIDSFFKLFLLFLPFTQALTINIGFPLKISEILLFFLILISISKAKISYRKRCLIDNNFILVFFLFWITVSFIVNVFWNYNYPLKEVPYRFSPLVDSFLRLVYIYLAIITFFLTVSYISKRENLLVFLIYGAIIAGVYAWYLFISSGLDIPYLKLFGMENNPQSLNGFIRCGTFNEGNFFGLYLLLSAIISFYLKRNKTGFFLMFSIITTLSTITFISAFVFAVYFFRKVLLRKKVLLYFFLSFPLILVVSIFFVQTNFYKTQIYSKITEPSNVISVRNISKVDRVLTSRIAYKIGLENPIFGVGAYNYGLHYDKYNDSETYIKNNNEWSLDFFKRKNRRAIPNNVYLEVWAEYGIIGFLLFVLFLAKTIWLTIKSRNDFVTGSIIAMLISFNAFPSFIMLFIWVFLAIPYAISYQKNY